MGTGAFLFVVLLFPDGRLMSPRWRIVAGLAIVATALSIVLSWLDPTPLVLAPGVHAVPNPTGVKGTPFTFANLWWAWPLGLLLLVIAAVGLVLRYRRAAGEERHQIKWFAFPSALRRPGHRRPTTSHSSWASASRYRSRRGSRSSNIASTASTS